METSLESVQTPEKTEVKKCSVCGRVLPISQFSKNAKHKDGLQYQCKECQAAYYREYRKRLTEQAILEVKDTLTVEDKSLTKVYAHAELATFTPRQLMEELKARGFVWEYMLEPQRKIKYEKI